MMTIRFILLISFLAVLKGCKEEQYRPAYELGHGCFSIQSQSGLFFSSGSLTKDPVQLKQENPEIYYIQPVNLKSFLLYDRQGHFLALSGRHLKRFPQPNKKAEWLIQKYPDQEKNDDSDYLILSRNGQRIVTVDKNKLTATRYQHLTSLTGFKFVRQQKNLCQTYPEVALDAFKNQSKNPRLSATSPITGFVDLHTHLAFPRAMASLTMSGEVFHPYGVKHALPSCKTLHGQFGKSDILESQHGGSSSGHATEGFPDFTYWPNRKTHTHVQTYHRWLERAFHSGLKIIVTLVTGNPAFCEILKLSKPGKGQGKCDGIAAIKQQTDYIYQIQDYIDAQFGGPGKGWFRIVTSPQQARAVIANQQLAVVLGAEHGDLFSCNHPQTTCTERSISKNVEQLYQMGLRSVFPIHRFDNMFGGTHPAGGKAGAWMHLAGRLNTSRIEHLTDLILPHKLLFKPIDGYFWDLGECPDHIAGSSQITNMKSFIEKNFAIKNLKKIPALGPFIKFGIEKIFIDKLKPIPDYHHVNESGRICNQRRLQPLGYHLIKELMAKGFMIEVDHLSYYTLLDSLELLEQYRYPGIVSSHGWLEPDPDIHQRIYQLGGIIGTMLREPFSMSTVLQDQMKEQQTINVPKIVALGSDIQGVSKQSKGNPDIKITYPFLSYDGSVTFTPPKTGNRRFNFSTEGLAHYGLLPEWLETLRLLGKQNTLDAIMSSAEAYLQMWERVDSYTRNQKIDSN